MITPELIEKIGSLAVKANSGARILQAPGEPPGVYYLVDESGQLQKVTADAPMANYKAYDLTTLAKLAEIKSDPQLWYNRAGVTLHFDEDDRREKAHLSLANSDQFDQLCQWSDAEGAALSQQELILLLRTTLRDTLAAHPGLLDKVRRVDIKKAQEATGIVQTAKVSMSRSMVAEASGADGLPDPLTFDVPVFSSPIFPARAKARAAFELDPQTERFKIVILPGEIERAYVDAEEFIRSRLLSALTDADAKDVPVYYGEP